MCTLVNYRFHWVQPSWTRGARFDNVAEMSPSTKACCIGTTMTKDKNKRHLRRHWTSAKWNKVSVYSILSRFGTHFLRLKQEVGINNFQLYFVQKKLRNVTCLNWYSARVKYFLETCWITRLFSFLFEWVSYIWKCKFCVMYSVESNVVKCYVSSFHSDCSLQTFILIT